jgi:hypothetical protein
MAKWFRKIWIGLLSGTAALVSCNLITPQPCYYGPPPVDPTEDTTKSGRREVLRQRIDAIRSIVEERSNSEIYGPPEMMEEYARETDRLMAEADSLEKELKALEKE